MPWITPDEPPGALVCYKIWLPSGVDYEACAVGAFLSLTEPENWEKVGGEEPEDVAEAFNDGWEVSVWWQECTGGGETGMVIGQVFWWPNSAAPDGALICNGGLHNIVDYPDLYDVVGQTFGGSLGTTFGVPNLADNFVLGYNNGLVGDTGGEDEHTLTEGEMPAHTHTINHGAASGGIPTESVARLPRKTGTDPTGSTGGDEPHNNMPPYIKLLPCIWAEDV